MDTVLGLQRASIQVCKGAGDSLAWGSSCGNLRDMYHILVSVLLLRRGFKAVVEEVMAITGWHHSATGCADCSLFLNGDKSGVRIN